MMGSKYSKIWKYLIIAAFLVFPAPQLMSESWAQNNDRKAIRLLTDPSSIAVGVPATAVRFYVLFSDIPPAQAPATLYHASGEVFAVDRLGRESRLGALSRNLEITSSPSRGGAGLEGIFQIDASGPKTLRFVAKIRAENNWSAVTQLAEIQIFDEKEINQTILRMTQGAGDQFPDHEAMAKTDVRDYAGMRRACRKSSCCLASVASMEKHRAFRNTQKECPSGYQGNMMRCVGSLRWCETATKK